MQLLQLGATIDERKRKLLLAFLILYAILTTVFLNSSASIRVQSDLFARWYATDKLLETGRNLYDPQNGQEISAFKTIQTSPLEAGFYYPAHLLVFLIPLSLLPFNIAHFVWTLAIQMLYIAAIWTLVRELGWPEKTGGATAFLLLSLFFIPFIQNTIWSQFDILGVFGLATAYLALRKERLVVAGIWMAGLTFKPQGALLVLVFLFIWAISSRSRWKFLGVFATTLFVLWMMAEIFQHGWVIAFLNSLSEYQRLPYKIESVLDKIWNPFSTLSILAIVFALCMFIYYRHSEPSETPFSACILLAIAVGWLVIPVIGMLQLVYFPAILIILFSEVKKLRKSWLYQATISFLLLYILGIVGFVYGLTSPERYGLHIELAELAYKTLAPILLLGFAVRLLIPLFSQQSFDQK